MTPPKNNKKVYAEVAVYKLSHKISMALYTNKDREEISV